MQAAEAGSFPSKWNAYRTFFNQYISESQSALNKLDSLATGKKIIGNAWATTCRSGQRTLRVAHTRATDQYQRDTGSRGLPSELEAWIADEYKAWENIENIGSELIGLHDEMLDQINAIEVQFLPKYRKYVGNVQVASKAAERTLVRLAGVKAANETGVASLLTRAISDVTKIMTSLNKANSQTVALNEKLKRLGYEQKVAGVVRKNIDPDQKGVFHGHEKKWESGLQARLTDFEQAYQDYKNEVEALESYEIITAYRYLKAAPRTGRSADVSKWLEATLPAAFAEPAVVESGDLRLGNIRLPNKLGVDEDIMVEVFVHNKGDAVVAAGDLELTCKVLRAQSPGTFNYTIKNSRPIAAGGGDRLMKGVTTPGVVGDVDLEWELRHKGKSVSKKRGKVTIQGESSASLGQVRFPRTIKADSKQRISVEIKNDGDTPIKASEANVQLAIKRSPSGYRHNSKDFKILLRPKRTISRGQSETLQGEISPPSDPAAQGDWVLEVQLKLGGRVIERKNVALKVQP